MPARRKKTVSDQTRIRPCSGFLSAGFRDYLGARVLLNACLPLQGAILASTSVEQYFKAILAFHGNSRTGHLCPALLRAVENCDRRLLSVLNRSFLSLLEKCYHLRYHDSIRVGFNIVVSARELLAELDFTVAQIEPKFAKSLQGGELLLGRLDKLIQQRDARLFRDNYLLAGSNKERFLQRPDFVYEMRLDPARGFLEAEYFIKRSPTDGGFLREGFAPIRKTEPGGDSYQLSLGSAGNLLVPKGDRTPPSPTL